MHPFVKGLEQAWPRETWQDVGVLVAVSGGADSVALLCAILELRDRHGSPGRVFVGHFNHRVRACSADDAQFVVELAERLHVPYFVGAAEQPVIAAGGEGWEATARAARYDYLVRVAKEQGARYLVTAHTADDQAETILHRILRGTGLSGLAGIQPVRTLDEALTLVRPLLGQTRADVVDYLASRQQGFCIDESNANLSYTRNRLRHSLLPQLAAQYNPNVREALLRLGQLAGEAQQVVERSARACQDSVVHLQAGGEVVIDCEPLLREPRHVVREMFVLLWKEQSWPLQQMGLDQWNQLADLATAGPAGATLILPGNLRATKKGTQLILRPLGNG
jgi:tRNA(Ile)-lysidine synthase